LSNTESTLTNQDFPDTHRLLGIYVYYRLCLGTLFGALFISGLGEGILGTTRPDIFFNTSILYMGLCFLSLTFYLLSSLKAHNSYHLLSLLITDFVVLIVMIYASGGISSGLGYLLLIPMAIGSIFLRGQANIGLAAFANTLDNSSNSQSVFTAGITGVLLFVTAISLRLLSEKLQTSQYAVKQQAEHTDYLHRLGQRIVETMHTGIVVVDKELNIQLMNNSAKSLLTHQSEFLSVKQIKPLYQNLKGWQEDGVIPSTNTVNLGVNHDIKISFANLSDNRLTSIMLFIEDSRRANQEAQQLKLASLGRLTASIAHEIRNPLGAISHAGQLLDESDHIHTNDQQLLGMIQKNSKRIDQIINNILQFSRRKNASPETINTTQWIEKFRHDYLESKKVTLDIKAPPKDVYCKVDPSHLHQIVSNLVDNGVRHSKKQKKSNTGSQVIINTNIDAKTKLPYIDIIDSGPGIQEDKIDDIFEPFYTTEVTGSGLGLYLCKELCQANQADILYFKKTKQTNSCFRLILCHPQRKI